MSYIDIINEFERWNQVNYLPPMSQLLYYKLLALFNKSAWQEWISAENKRLMAEIKIRREATFIQLRNCLIDKQLIDYKKGKKGSPGKYKLKEISYSYEVKSETKNAAQSVVKTETIHRERKRTRERESNYLSIITLYKKICISLPVSKSLTQKRRQALKIALEHGYEIRDFEQAFAKAQASSFLRGENSRGWRADFDWLITVKNMKKVLDGLYDDAPERKRQEKSDNIFIQLLQQGGSHGQAGRT